MDLDLGNEGTSLLRWAPSIHSGKEFGGPSSKQAKSRTITGWEGKGRRHLRQLFGVRSGDDAAVRAFLWRGGRERRRGRGRCSGWRRLRPGDQHCVSTRHQCEQHVEVSAAAHRVFGKFTSHDVSTHNHRERMSSLLAGPFIYVLSALTLGGASSVNSTYRRG